MELKLKVLQGKNAGQEVAITGQKFLIGRAEDCHLRPGSETISRHHCAIVVDQTYVAIRDFGSKNGTYVNNQRVVGECELKPGDRFRVGPLEFEILFLQGELGGKKRPPVNNPKEAAERTAAGPPTQQDISQWLSDPASEARGSAALDTQSFRLTDTKEIPIPQSPTFAAPRGERSVQLPQAAQSASEIPEKKPQSPAPTATTARPTPPSSATEPGAGARPANLPKRALPSTFQMPEPDGPTPAAEDGGDRLNRKKVYGKLPVQPKRAEDTRSAAADLLGKLRKRS
jgi:hypothetical protein